MGGARTLLEPFGNGNLSTTWNHNYCNLCYLENDVLLQNNLANCQLYKQHYETGVLGINNKDNVDNFSIYPNPTTNQITISGLTNENQEIEIFDMNGKQILKTAVNNNQSLDVSNLNRGIYIIRFEKSLFSKKIIIE